MIDDAHTSDCDALAAAIARSVSGSGWTVAIAESVTGGHVATALAAAESSANWFRGGVVAYGTVVKQSVLGVDPGPVINPRTARQMATGVRRLVGADFAVATTGVGGPGPEEGVPAGTVFIAVAGPRQSAVERFHFDGEPPDVVDAATRQALRNLFAALQAVTAELTTTSAGTSVDQEQEQRR